MSAETTGASQIERLERERDEWKRLAEERAMGTKRLLADHDALAAQNEALRCDLARLKEHTGAPDTSCMSLILDTLRAAKIAEARRKVCEAATEFDKRQRYRDAGTPLHEMASEIGNIGVALAELRKVESENHA